MTFIFWIAHGNTLSGRRSMMPLRATAHKRGTEQHLAEAAEVFEEVENSPVMRSFFRNRSAKKFSYAADLEWNIIMGAVRGLYALGEKNRAYEKHGHYCKVCRI